MTEEKNKKLYETFQKKKASKPLDFQNKKHDNLFLLSNSYFLFIKREKKATQRYINIHIEFDLS